MYWGEGVMRRLLRLEAWVAIAAVAMALLLLLALTRGLVGQLNQLREIRAAQATLMPLIAHEQQRQQTLLQEVTRVSSPTYAEEWARVYGGMTQPGEVRLVVALPEEHAIPADPTATPASVAEPFWLQLWHWLGGGAD